ncbi:hypothetical protein [Brevundimonas sp.]|uniref:hypothetical protein n=1 Tax=Brevundimonas sp. TaxID=1871086 RepID=UPI002D73B77B|nr:hypothetical protein [Brevundimonas sp.]HYD28258.1 hypothetical protein [Brevundimonas sp.]
MTAMSRPYDDPDDTLLEREAWEAPWHMSADDLYLEAGADRRGGRGPIADREDDR